MAIERTLVQIRERPLVDLLDLALVVVRRRPVTLGLAALAGIAPFAALNAWLFRVDRRTSRRASRCSSGCSRPRWRRPR